ncbi:MAG: hypothetical protein GXO49_05055 [Chlorobi bacterium]|nr:hypothetical protein [Chlorobiota bacterium]
MKIINLIEKTWVILLLTVLILSTIIGSLGAIAIPASFGYLYIEILHYLLTGGDIDLWEAVVNTGIAIGGGILILFASGVAMTMAGSLLPSEKKPNFKINVKIGR